MAQPTGMDLPFDLERLLEDGVAEILRHEDSARFLTWLRQNLIRYMEPDFMLSVPPDARDSLAITLGQNASLGKPQDAHALIVLLDELARSLSR